MNSLYYFCSSFADGISSFNEIEELKHKESDRLSAMQEGLDKMKIKNFLDGDAFCIEGMGKDYKIPNFFSRDFL